MEFIIGIILGYYGKPYIDKGIELIKEYFKTHKN